MSQFCSVVKTTPVRVHVLFTGPLDNHTGPACPVQGENWLPAHLYPKPVLGDHLLGRALSAQSGLHRASSCRVLGGIAALKPLWEPVSTALPPGLKGKSHFKAKILGTKVNLLIAFFA